ncbi:phosphotransferase enzyme family protein [Apiospora rasikravindrae]|uniref:Phosphotransferase enzyme family protein n=1 Tax=Apiospora rasikravindrae TaxID=990691 RepID=A0ABR1UDZ5_9PEZI
MDLTPKAIQEVVHPTAAFSPEEDGALDGGQGLARDSWASSLLNPCNRIDSLDYPKDIFWRVDGCAGLGTQYYAIPLFISPVPPIRMDVFIPENQPPLLRHQLDLNLAFHTKDSERLSRLAITRHIIRTLQLWVATEFADIETFTNFYRKAPFGTRLVLENLSLDIRQIEVKVGPNHYLERQLLSAPQLAGIWGHEFRFPEEVDFFDVDVVKVLHDSVCLARIKGQLYIFKALTSGAKYLYHELKVLSTIPPHSNVIPRPVHIVRKTCAFGAKKAIAGFTTVYQPKGSLRDILPRLRIHNQLHAAKQFKWCMQLTTALDHLRSTTGTYYPDLRLDNVVLSENDDIIMVDFEQRGVWCEFAAPEVNSVEYIRLVAVEERISDDVREKYQDILSKLVPNYVNLEDDQYTNPEDGYNLSWVCLSPVEQEAAEVYMLGRVLWCIFEGVSGPQKAAIWQSYHLESDLEFPEYQRTPPELRVLIDRCTRGRRETLSRIVQRQGSILVIRNRPAKEQTSDEVRDAARAFWETELQVAEDFIALRSRQKAAGVWNDNYYDRPTIREVLAELGRLREKLCC